MTRDDAAAALRDGAEAAPAGEAEPLHRIREALRRSHPAADHARLLDAWRLARRAHAGQYRKTGDPYVTHPLEVAAVVADSGLDEHAVVAAVLHDVVEDTSVDLAEIRDRFGDEAADLVDGLTKVDRAADRAADRSFDGGWQQTAEDQADTLRKLVVASADDVRVLVLKLADRLHNMRTIHALSAAKQHRVAVETLEVYVPLAHRLGLAALRSELADLAFEVAYPETAGELRAALDQRAPDRDAAVEEAIAALRSVLRDAGIPAEVMGRAKGLWSVYDKMTRRGVPFSEIADLIGVRVICDEVHDVYAALGEVHARWTPLPGKVKDYIATPKFNFYQSLHTTVVGPRGHAVEIQLRTREMHRRAEYGPGAASHWAYKQHAGQAGNAPWIRELADRTADEQADPQEFLDAVRGDLLRGEVYAFTPHGDAVVLPAGATPVDFAYHIHTEVGHRCVAARVNGRTRSLRAPLDSGDRVEIVTSDDRDTPSPAWLDHVVTARARRAIRARLAEQRRRGDAAAGEELLRSYARGVGLADDCLDVVAGSVDAAAGRLGYEDREALLAAVARGEAAASDVLAASDRCCAFHTVAVDADTGVGDPADTAADGEPGKLRVVAVDRRGVLADVAAALDRAGVDIAAAAATRGDDGMARLRFAVVADDPEQRDAAAVAAASVDDVVAVNVAADDQPGRG